MFGSKKKKRKQEQESTDREIEELRSQLETYRSVQERARNVGISLLDFPQHGGSGESLIESEDEGIEFCSYTCSPVGPPGTLYHHTCDEEADLFVFGDVAGRSSQAALTAVYLKGLFEEAADRYRISGGSSWVGEILMEINDRLLLKELRGAFVAVKVVLLWRKSGTVYLWNMGSSGFLRFRSSAGELTSFSLTQTPAMGIFDSDMLRVQGGGGILTPQKITMEKGDQLIFLDDGLEESRRPKPPADAAEDGDGGPHGGGDQGSSEAQSSGQDQSGGLDKDSAETEEEFGPERIEALLGAVLTGGRMQIHAPSAASAEDSTKDNGVWELNFSSLSGGADESGGAKPSGDSSGAEPDESGGGDTSDAGKSAEVPHPRTTVLSLLAAEKLFRLTPAPKKSSGTADPADNAGIDYNDAALPARVSGKLLAFINSIVENGGPLEAKEPLPKGETVKLEEERGLIGQSLPQEISGYSEYPLNDDLFALVIQKTRAQ